MSKQTYTAETYGAIPGCRASFPTITAARQWAEEYGNTIHTCVITDNKGKVVAKHKLDQSGKGNKWRRVTVS